MLKEPETKVLVSVVSKDIPLETCPIGTRLVIRKEMKNPVDPKALPVYVQHKRTGKWVFLGYVAANPDYVPEDGINNAKLFDLMGPTTYGVIGEVVDKMQVVFPYGVSTALLVEVPLS